MLGAPAGFNFILSGLAGKKTGQHDKSADSVIAVTPLLKMLAGGIHTLRPHSEINK